MEGRADVGQPSLGPLPHADSPMATSPADALPAEIPAAICDWAEPRRSVITDFGEAPTPFHMEYQYRFFSFSIFFFQFQFIVYSPSVAFLQFWKKRSSLFPGDLIPQPAPFLYRASHVHSVLFSCNDWSDATNPGAWRHMISVMWSLTCKGGMGYQIHLYRLWQRRLESELASLESFSDTLSVLNHGGASSLLLRTYCTERHVLLVCFCLPCQCDEWQKGNTIRCISENRNMLTLPLCATSLATGGAGCGWCRWASSTSFK